MSNKEIELFERAFGSGGGGCRRTCECDQEFYNDDEYWDWEEGELEALRGNAISLDYTVSTVVIDGVEYVADCSCWHKEARKVMAWIESHKYSIEKYFKLVYEQKQKDLRNAIKLPANIIYQLGNDAWKAMSDAPKGRTIEVLSKDEKTVVEAHWASDRSGEYQPPFEGWFTKAGSGYVQISDPISWREVLEEK